MDHPTDAWSKSSHPPRCVFQAGRIRDDIITRQQIGQLAVDTYRTRAQGDNRYDPAHVGRHRSQSGRSFRPGFTETPYKVHASSDEIDKESSGER